MNPRRLLACFTTRLMLLCATAASILMLAPASMAESQIDESRRRAREYFAEGVRSFDAGEYEGALISFQSGYELHDHPVFLYNIARCLERLDRPAEAAEVYEEYLEMAEANDEPQDRLDQAGSQLDELRGRLAVLRISVRPAEAIVTIDGREIAASRRPTEHLHVPGTAEVVARLEGYITETREINLDAGTSTDLAIVLEPRAGRLELRIPGQRGDEAISIDGQPWTEDDNSLPAGLHQVSVTTPDGESWEGEVLIESNRTTTLRIVLEERRRLHRVWFYSLLGVTLTTSLAAVITGSMAISHRASWLESYDPSDRDSGLALRNSTDWILLAVLVESIATVTVGVFTNFRASSR